jgi:hypothetical protein
LAVPRAPRPTRADISIFLDRDGGPTSIHDEDDHAMALAEHHGAT